MKLCDLCGKEIKNGHYEIILFGESHAYCCPNACLYDWMAMKIDHFMASTGLTLKIEIKYIRE